MESENCQGSNIHEQYPKEHNATIEPSARTSNTKEAKIMSNYQMKLQQMMPCENQISNDFQ